MNTGQWDTGSGDDIEEKFYQARFIDEKPERNSFKVALENIDKKRVRKLRARWIPRRSLTRPDS